MAEVYQAHRDIGGDRNEIRRREDIREAITRAEELRALHAALMQGKAAATERFDSVSPLFSHPPQLSAEDYPVFTPSYVDEPLPGYQQHLLDDRECWHEYNLEADEAISADYKMSVPFSDHYPAVCSCGNEIPALGHGSRRSSLGDLKPSSYCNKCKPAIVSTEPDGSIAKSCRKTNIIVPYTDSQPSINPQPTSKGVNLSWLIPRIKRKGKESSPTQSQPEKVLQVGKDHMDMASVEALKKELVEANQSRDAALTEVAEMKSTLVELSQKLDCLEAYCEELKALSQDHVQVKNDPRPDENFMPVSDEMKVEGFLQIVSEARFSMKRFCRALVGQIEETDQTLVNNLNLLLQPYKLSRNSKAILHLEAVINQCLYQDFENCVFQKNGSPKILDPHQDRRAKFQSYTALRNLSWNQVLRKGTKHYSDEFSDFCDDKMREIIATLGWSRPWCEQLLQAFFVAAKCIWLLHLLAFSFNPALNILRVEENRPFESDFMEDMVGNRAGGEVPTRVKVMVMPGFYVDERVVKCKVLCKYKPVP